MTELNRLISEICQLNLIKAVFSVPYNKSEGLSKATLRAVGDGFQIECFKNNQAFHENLNKDFLPEKLINLLTSDFRQAEFFTSNFIYGIKISSKGKVLHNKRRNTNILEENKTHNKIKKHIIDIENAPEVFFDIGIVDKDGKIINSKYDKYKQISRFIEFIDDVVRNDPRESYNIVDFGCGKSYLTFVCYHYMTKIANKKVNIVGLDLKEKVIEDCNKLCAKYGYENLTFLCMDIKDYLPKVKPDMVIALHACDKATDYAIYNAYRWQADYIFSVPCCQHELNSKINSKNFKPLCDYGIIKERISALMTDAVRGKILELCGYNVDILEFIDIEHSPKNILIRARRTTRISDIKRNAVYTDLSCLINEFSADLELQKLVESHNREIVSDGKTFKVVVGKASMLLKDALTVRGDVFGDEQGYKNGAKRDVKDETAWFANIYFDTKVIATSRMTYLENDSQRLFGKIAVLPKYRSFGLGREMLYSLEKICAEEKCKRIYVNSQKQAVEFYQKNGFTSCGEPYFDEQIEHIPMCKNI